MKTIGLILVVGIAAILIYATTKPNSFHIERSTVIQAPATKIFPYLNDFHRWSEWSPWETLDPNMKRSFSGATTGQGASYAWEGNMKVGSGRMTIVQSVPPSKIQTQLDFQKPMEGHDMAEFTLEPQGKATKVTWSMSGPSPYISKVMCVFMNMDKMVGKNFEDGLAKLKTITEK